MKFGVLILAILFAPVQLSAFDWVAHRANANGEIENSLNATIAAWSIPADIVELDVRVSKDDVVYLYHDSEVDGTSIRLLNFAEIRELVGEPYTPDARFGTRVRRAPRALHLRFERNEF